MFITTDTLNSINLELTDYCNAACPMCSRFKWDGSLHKEKVNQNHTTLKILQKRIPEKIIKQLKQFHEIFTSFHIDHHLDLLSRIFTNKNNSQPRGHDKNNSRFLPNANPIHHINPSQSATWPIQKHALGHTYGTTPTIL